MSLLKIIINSFVDGSGCQLKNVLVQYIFEKEEHEVTYERAHGNSKHGIPYRRTMPSTIQQIKASAKSKDKTPKEMLDDVYCSLGDVLDVDRLDKLPRGPKDLYNARYNEKRRDDSKGTLAVQTQESAIIRECKIHPSLYIVLASDKQLKQVAQFCTNPREFAVYSIDPTFNVFEKNISLTVTSYRNLRLVSKQTNKSPVFIGPMMMHQKKDWKTYFHFGHSLLAENQDLEGILACGTDGEKALIDGLKKSFRFAVFLRCFLHMKDNIKREK